MAAGWASGEPMIGRRRPVHRAGSTLYAHRFPHRYLAAGRRRARHARARLRALSRRPRPHRPRRHDGRRRAGGAAVRGRGGLAQLPFPLRYGPGRAARRPRGAERRRPLRLGDATPPRPPLPALARRPFVAKLVSDPAYERAQRYGRFHGSLEEFQGASTRGRARAEGRCGRRVAARAPARSSSRARTWPRSRPAGGSAATGSTC